MLQKIVPFSYALSVAMHCFAVLNKIILQAGHWESWFIACLASQFLFAFAAIYEMKQSKNIAQEEKAKWNGYLLLTPLLSGLVYQLTTRKRIVS